MIRDPLASVSRLANRSTQDEEAVNSRRAPTLHWASLHQNSLRLSFSNQQVAFPEQGRLVDGCISNVTLTLYSDLGDDFGVIPIIHPVQQPSLYPTIGNFALRLKQGRL